jgi:hypothetical protein
MAITRVTEGVIAPDNITSNVIADGAITVNKLDNQAQSPTFRNRIINGAMRIDQRNAGASVTLNANGVYPVDRWRCDEVTDGGATGEQVQDAPEGFVDSLKITTTTADVTLSSSQYMLINQFIEGFNTADFGFGTANAKTITLSFWVKSSLTGTFAGGFDNNDNSRSYVFNYTISSANTWEYKTITIVGDTSGTWNTTNARGLGLRFGLGSGTDFDGTVGAWQSGLKFSSSGAVSVIGTLNATWQITGVQLEAGTVATPFERRQFEQELALCQRYFYRWVNDTGGVCFPFAMQNFSASAAYGKLIDLPVTMRATPTCSTSGTFTGMSSAGAPTTTFTGTTIDSPTKQTLSTGQWSGSSGMTAGQCQPVRVASNAFIQASAEL